VVLQPPSSAGILLDELSWNQTVEVLLLFDETGAGRGARPSAFQLPKTVESVDPGTWFFVLPLEFYIRVFLILLSCVHTSRNTVACTAVDVRCRRLAAASESVARSIYHLELLQHRVQRADPAEVCSMRPVGGASLSSDRIPLSPGTN
jgi:hypothetical protein